MVLVIGFDLDMTLIDSRAGVHAAMRALVAETGAPIDPDVVVARLGPPLERELAEWVPADQIDPLADRYRELYAEVGIEGTVALPGRGRRARRSARDERAGRSSSPRSTSPTRGAASSRRTSR